VGQEIAAQWWELYRCPPLDEAVRRAIAGSPTLAAAEATLAQGQEAVVQARAAYYPQLSASGSAERHGAGHVNHNLFSLGPTVSYSPDVFGGTRRRVEQAAALAEGQDRRLAAVYLTLTGNVVSQAVTIAGVGREIAATEQIVADDEKNTALVRTKFAAGKAAQTDVLVAESQLANDRALLPPLRQALSAAEHAFSVLLGDFPASSPPPFTLDGLTLPGDLPVRLPSELVHARPDILAAEADLHAASAAIGIATAAMYPSITLSASAGQAATTTGAFFNGASTFWSLASSVAAPLFEGGALTSQKRGAVDAFRASAAIYRETVLEAFAQVADTLDALAHDAELVGDQRRALDVASRSLELERLSYAEGKATVLDLLNSERLDQQAQLGYARAQTVRYQDTTQLFVAMGGPWWRGPTPDAKAVAPEHAIDDEGRSSTEQPPREDEQAEAEQVHGREHAREVRESAAADDRVSPVPAGEHVVDHQHHALVEPVH
jgi:NodT family efflux transporter outer membrane factor (OMF) lipoprotein